MPTAPRVLGPQRRRNSERAAWFVAWALALVLHAGLIPLFRNITVQRPASPVRQQLAPIRLVFQKPDPQARKSETPHFFTELPPDRADAAPKKADFLSNVTSHASDRVPGGDTPLPRMQGESDVPAVKLEPDGGAPPSPAAAPQPPQPNPAHATESQQRPDVLAPSGAAGAAPAPRQSEPATPPPPADAASRGPVRAGGGSDIYQPEMDNPSGNAAPTGDVSLSTTAWDYAPWLQRFGRQLMRRWIPPPAYELGILKEGGWAVLEMEISKEGKPLRLELLEEHGHPSLILAARNALDSMAPIEPLPADFPEPTLTLRIRMIYPKIHPR